MNLRGLGSSTVTGCADGFGTHRILRMEGDGDVFAIRAWREDEEDTSDEDEDKDWAEGILYQ